MYFIKKKKKTRKKSWMTVKGVGTGAEYENEGNKMLDNFQVCHQRCNILNTLRKNYLKIYISDFQH